jgi:alpha-glucosidase
MSPNGDVEFRMAGWPAEGSPGPSLGYRVSFRGEPVIVDSALGLELARQPPIAPGPSQTALKTGGVAETYTVPVGKSNPVKDRHNFATVEYTETGTRHRRLVLEVRVFDDGVAFRYVLPKQDALGAVEITRERTEFRFAKDGTAFPMILSGFGSSYEDEYQKRLVSGLHPDWLIGAPLLVELPGIAWAAITEAHIEDYPGMYLRKKLAAPFGFEAQLMDPRR